MVRSNPQINLAFHVVSYSFFERLERNDRLTYRRRTIGEATAVLIALDGLFSPVAVDVMDVSSGGVGILVPQGVSLVVGSQVALRLPVRPSGHKLYRMEVRWLKVGDLLVLAGLAFL